MSRHPARFDFEGDLLPAQAEASADRRLRTLENTFPAVREWEISARSRAAADGAGHRAEANVAATLVGGHRLKATAFGTDALGALRLAFNALEAQLHEENEDDRPGPFHWFEKVKSRTAGNWFGAD